MIKSKDDLNEYLNKDMQFYKEYSKKEKIMCFILRDPVHYINAQQ